MFSEECKYIIKQKMIPKDITDDIEISSDSNEESSDEETVRKNLDGEKSILIMKKILMGKY